MITRPSARRYVDTALPAIHPADRCCHPLRLSTGSILIDGGQHL
ncbi:hypothetical protein [Streptomyces sp. NPDC059814]